MNHEWWCNCEDCVWARQSEMCATCGCLVSGPCDDEFDKMCEWLGQGETDIKAMIRDGDTVRRCKIRHS